MENSEKKLILDFKNENLDLFTQLINEGFKISAILEALENNFISSATGYYEEHEGVPYDEDDFIVFEGRIRGKDELNYCDYSEDYTDEDVVAVFLDRRETQYWAESIAEDRAVYVGGDYYSKEHLEYWEIYITEDTGEYMFSDDGFWDDIGYFYEYESNARTFSEYISEYHENKRVIFENFGKENVKRYIGFEIEKEDEEILKSIYIDDFIGELPNYRKEKDGSLDDNGFELVTPAYALCLASIEKEIFGNRTLRDHINADTSERCGGHINISERGLSGDELFSKIKGYAPLLFAMYPNRTNNNYCQAKTSQKYITEKGKYNAFHIQNNHVEIRIFSALKNCENLLWRAGLIDLMLKYTARTPEQAMKNLNKKVFRKHFAKVYSQDKFYQLIFRFGAKSKEYEGRDLTELANKITENN